MLKRLTTLATVTAFVSAVSVPAAAQRRGRRPRNPPPVQQPQGAAAGGGAAAGAAAGGAAAGAQVQAGAQGAAAAPTPEARAAARAEYDQGTAAFTARNFEAALQHFERAYGHVDNPVVLISIANSQEQLGRIPDAIATLNRWLRDQRTGAAPNRPEITARVEALQRRPATVHVVSTPAGGRILLDGTDTNRVTPADIEVPSGHHAIRVELAGHNAFTQELDVGPGARQELTAQLQTSAPAFDAAAAALADDLGPAPNANANANAGAQVDRPASRGPGPVVWVSAGLAAAGLVAGSVFGFMALSDHAEYERMPTAQTRDRGETNALLADISFGVAILAASVAVVVYFSRDQGPPAASQRASGEQGAQGARRASASHGGIRLLPNGMALSF